MTESILIVEDEGASAIGLKKKLEQMGFLVPNIASSGEEAIEFAARYRPDLILMDIVPKKKVDDIEAAGKIPGTLDIPIIYLTAYSDEITSNRVMTKEPFGYIVKPYNDRELQIGIDFALYKHRMEKLKENYHWLETVLRSISDAVIATDQNGRIAFMNPVAEKLVGRDYLEVTGKKIEEIFRILDGATGEPVNGLVSRVLAENTVISSTGKILVTADGSEKPLDCIASPLFDSEQRSIGVALVFKDLTSQKAAEMESRMREMVMASSGHPLCITDLEGRIKYVNASFNELWGDEGELAGRQLLEFCQNEEKLHEIKETLKARGSWIGEIAATKRDGSNLFIRQEAKRIDDGFGKSIGIVYSFLDITELKESREELKKYIAKLHKTDNEIEEITDDLASKIKIIYESIDKIRDIYSNNRADRTNERAMALLADARNAVDQISMLQDRLIEFSLPSSLYVYLADLYRQKIEDLATKNKQDESYKYYIRRSCLNRDLYEAG